MKNPNGLNIVPKRIDGKNKLNSQTRKAAQLYREQQAARLIEEFKRPKISDFVVKSGS